MEDGGFWGFLLLQGLLLRFRGFRAALAGDRSEEGYEQNEYRNRQERSIEGHLMGKKSDQGSPKQKAAVADCRYHCNRARTPSRHLSRGGHRRWENHRQPETPREGANQCGQGRRDQT